MKNMTFKKITSQRLFLPIFCLALVLLVNIVTTPNFFAIEVRNGVLYGYLIDIINRASELVILAVGMTLVVSVLCWNGYFRRRDHGGQCGSLLQPLNRRRARSNCICQSVDSRLPGGAHRRRGDWLLQRFSGCKV